MNLSAKSISINNSTKISLHPLAKKLSKLITSAYIVGKQEAYLESLNTKFSCYNSLPINHVSVISSHSNSYEAIGGCFVPFFNLKSLNKDNALFIQYKSSKKDVKPEHKKRYEQEFEQDVVDFIYMDFIRTISVLSLLKPGSMYPELKKLTQDDRKYRSSIWKEVFESKEYLRQEDFALLLDVKSETIRRQFKT